MQDSERTETAIVAQEPDNLPTIANAKQLSRKVKARMRQVRLLKFVRQWSVAEIAEALKVSERTILNDITYIRKTGRTLGQLDMEYRNDCVNFLWELNDKYEQRVKYLWNMFNKSNDEKNKISILAEIRKQEQQHFDNLQSLGILPKEAEKFIHGITYVSKLKGEEVKDEKPREVRNLIEHTGDSAVIN